MKKADKENIHRGSSQNRRLTEGLLYVAAKAADCKTAAAPGVIFNKHVPTGFRRYLFTLRAKALYGQAVVLIRNNILEKLKKVLNENANYSHFLLQVII